MALAMTISIHIPRVGDDPIHSHISHNRIISIHIPRVGDDLYADDGLAEMVKISIHIPRVGDDLICGLALSCDAYFNQHPPCGG